MSSLVYLVDLRFFFSSRWTVHLYSTRLWLYYEIDGGKLSKVRLLEQRLSFVWVNLDSSFEVNIQQAVFCSHQWTRQPSPFRRDSCMNIILCLKCWVLWSIKKTVVIINHIKLLWEHSKKCCKSCVAVIDNLELLHASKRWIGCAHLSFFVHVVVYVFAPTVLFLILDRSGWGCVQVWERVGVIFQITGF